TNLIGRGVGDLVKGDPAAGCAIGDGVGGDAGVIAPLFETAGGVDGDEDVHGRAEVKVIAHLERRVFWRVFALCGFGWHVAGVEFSDAFQSINIVRRDLGEGREAY